MKKLLLLLFLIPNMATAELYNCQYKWDDEKFEVLFERKQVHLDSKTYTYFLYKQKKKVGPGMVKTNEEILFEDDEHLILGNIVKGKVNLFRTIWIDKFNKKFRIATVKEPHESFNEKNVREAMPQGIYGVADGECT